MPWQFKSSVDPKNPLKKGALARRIPNNITHSYLVFEVKGHNGCREDGEHLYQPTKVDLYGKDGVCVLLWRQKRYHPENKLTSLKNNWLEDEVPF